MSTEKEKEIAALGCLLFAGFAIYVGLEVLGFLIWVAESVSDAFTWISIHFWQILGGIILLFILLIVARWLLMLLIEAAVFIDAKRDGEAYDESSASDDEALRLADHRRDQGQPEYIQAVTEQSENGAFDFCGMSGDDREEDPQYRKACRIVFESQKASVSWLQRQLGIGYNSAAGLIGRMEEDGFIGAPDHIGRRKVLRNRNGDPV